MDFFKKIEDELLKDNIYFTGTHSKKSIDILFPEEKKNIAQAIIKRQEDLATGRWCAREAIKQLSVPEQPILIGNEGEPIWPEGICGSISHTKDAYCCAVASTDQYLSIGIDIENTTRKISSKTMAMIANEDEHIWLNTHQNREKYEKLIFCAKESIFKLFYPLIKQRFFFSAVSLLPVISDTEFTFIINKELDHKYFINGKKYKGQYLFNTDWVFAFCFLEN